MDGSRRYSTIYGKTQAGADALTAGRGVLSSSARQLLILLDGERDFDELSRIFGEETLYRLLPFLESQGFVEPLNERATPQDKTPAPFTNTRAGIPTSPPTTVLPTAVPTITQVAAPMAAQVEVPPATLTESLPIPAPAKSPRFLAVPIAILVSLATAAAIVNWVFDREQHAAESTQQVQDVTGSASSTTIASKPSSAGGSIPPNTGIQSAQIKPSAESSESIHAPASATPINPLSDQPGATEASSLAGEKGSPLALRAKIHAEPSSGSSKAAASDAGAPSTELAARSAQRTKVASNSTGEAATPSPQTAKTQPDENSAQIGPRSKITTESASARPKEAPPGAESAPATQQGTLALAAPDSATAQRPAPASATVGLHVRTRVLPTISKRALESGIYGGKAVVRLHVNSAGTVERVELVSADPPEVYGPDVQHALEQWTFEPPSNPAQFTLDLDFREQPPAPSVPPGKPPEGP